MASRVIGKMNDPLIRDITARDGAACCATQRLYIKLMITGQLISVIVATVIAGCAYEAAACFKYHGRNNSGRYIIMRWPVTTGKLSNVSVISGIINGAE